MTGDDAVFRDAFGACGSDVVLGEGFAQATAGEAGDGGGGDESECEGGEDPVVGIVPAGGVEPMELEAEEEGEEGAEDEAGDADAEGGEGHGEAVFELACAKGCDGSGGDADEDGDDEGGAADGEGDGHALGDDFADIPAFESIGDGEVEGDEAPEVATELDDEGLIKAVEAVEVFADVVGHFAFVGEGAAGAETDDEEGDGDDGDDDHEALEEALEDEAGHGEGGVGLFS